MKGYVHAFTRLYRKAKAVAARDAHGVYIYIILIFIQLHRLISLSKDRTINLLYLYATVHNRNRNSNPQFPCGPVDWAGCPDTQNRWSACLWGRAYGASLLDRIRMIHNRRGIILNRKRLWQRQWRLMVHLLLRL